MKKLINTAFYYSIAAMVAGVFFREATRMLDYTQRTYLSLSHGHLFMLGTVVMLLLAILSTILDFAKQPGFKKSFLVYNIGLIWTVIMFEVHGMMQLFNMEITAMISGIAGLGHIIWGIGLVWILLQVKKSAKNHAE